MTKHRAARTILCALLICALILPMIPLGSMADTARYGRINADKVRFRKTASTMEGSEWWCLLDTGWVLLIRGELTAAALPELRTKLRDLSNGKIVLPE